MSARPEAATVAPVVELKPDDGEPQALVVTHWFDAGAGDAPYPATVRLRGRRLGVTGTPRVGDSFVQDEELGQVVPGSGRISLTTWIYGVTGGDWEISAELIRGGDSRLRDRRRAKGAEVLPRASWSWSSWRLASAADAPVATRWALLAPLARMPAVAPGVWTVLGVIGVIAAVIIQSAIVAGRGVPTGPSLIASVLAIAAGLVAAKVWYAVLAPTPWRQSLARGWAVDGFLVATPLVGILALLAQGSPVGIVLDASAPGIFLAVFIGRVGCFVTGCCAGPMTAGRFGIWSSDRRVGARRIPIQLVESGAGLVLAIVASVLVVIRTPLPDGVIFLATFLAYALVRQGILRLRAEARSYSWRRTAPVIR